MDLVTQQVEVGMDNGKIFKITPSGVDYALECKRCLWLAVNLLHP